MSQARYSGAGTAHCPRCGGRYDVAARYCQRDGAPLVSGETEADPYLGRELLGQFRIEEVIGTGGMGTVYRARQPSLDRDVAIKILHAELAGNAEAVRRFQREARVATALDHPNVVRVLLLGQLDDGSLYLVMEHLSGRSLGQLVRDEGPLPLERALRIALQICDGVGEAHSHGVVHRDVKPENVVIVHRGRERDFVKVLDFGIARLLWDEQTMVTQSGLIFGTARYISPEGASGEPTDARSDVYSIGVLLYQLLCGETPFDGDTPVTLLLQHVHDTPPDIRERVRVADPVAEVIMRALRKRPAERFDDAAAFGDALREAALASGALSSPMAGAARAPGGSSFAPSVPGAAAPP
ncbi:MAG: protein kinase domain-containing protein, partial [Myxococcota bacterium]